MPIKYLHKIEQPREKLQKYTAERLNNAELLAIILNTGTRGLGVLKLSKKILSVFKKRSLAQVSLRDLMKIKGLGLGKSSRIVASFELSKRFLESKKVSILLSPKEVWLAMKEFNSSKKEHFVVFFLNTQNEEVNREVISVGTLNSSIVHPREVFEPAVKNLAASIIIAHNHPSGSLEPSPEDIEVTKRLQQAGEILGIHILDHVIVTKQSFFSFKRNGLI